MENTTIVIIDDNLPTDDPLVFELEDKYKYVKLFAHSQAGLDFIVENLSKKIIVVLDISFSANEKNGHEILDLIRQQSKLIPVIIWSAKDAKTGEDFTDFINNQALFYVKQTSTTKEILNRIHDANKRLKLDIATAIEEWLEQQDNKDQAMIYHGNGNIYNANNLIKEIRNQSQVGQEIEENMIKLTIDLLFRKKEKV